MKQMLKDYACKYEDQLNTAIMNKEYDDSLVSYIVDAWKSLEVVKQIKFKGYTYTEKESDIDINRHIFKREKNKKRKDKYDIKFVEDSRVGKLTVELEVTMLETDPQTNESKMVVYPLKKSML